MDTEVELDGDVFRRIGEDWYYATTYIRVPQVVARKLDAHLRASTGASPSMGADTGKSGQRSPTDGYEDSTFRHAEAFPIIADVIGDRYKQKGDFVTHREIVDAFLTHPEGGALAEEAAKEQGKPVENVASNIVAWFSKRFTEEDTTYQDVFERERIDGRWAYRLVEH